MHTCKDMTSKQTMLSVLRFEIVLLIWNRCHTIITANDHKIYWRIYGALSLIGLNVNIFHLKLWSRKHICHIYMFHMHYISIWISQIHRSSSGLNWTQIITGSEMAGRRTRTEILLKLMWPINAPIVFRNLNTSQIYYIRYSPETMSFL